LGHLTDRLADRERSLEDAVDAACSSAVRRAAASSKDEVALVLVAGPEQGLSLRAFVGAANRSSAQALAASFSGEIEALLGSGGHSTLEAAAPVAGMPASRFEAIALESRGRRHGALVVSAPLPGPDAPAELRRIAGRLAERIDHLRLEREVEGLRERLRDRDAQAERKGEELLKLSEALFAQDIELLRKDEKLGKVERLKNDFIEKMSCELRTPLNGIIEAIIAVLANENDSLSEAAKQGLRSALDDGTSFLRTLQNILDLWRLKQGELPVEIHEVSFREVVDEAIFSTQDALSGKDIRIEKRFEEPFPKVRTDLAKVNQILFLLLDNAARFTERGKIEIRAAVREGELVCAVEDTGIGICADDQQFIFDAFYQVDEPGGSRFRGAGLGLALVHDLVGLLGGSLEVSSEVGRGSTFVFRLPVQLAD
jgi:signal transduction histidine kinase